MVEAAKLPAEGKGGGPGGLHDQDWVLYGYVWAGATITVSRCIK